MGRAAGVAAGGFGGCLAHGLSPDGVGGSVAAGPHCLEFLQFRPHQRAYIKERVRVHLLFRVLTAGDERGDDGDHWFNFIPHWIQTAFIRRQVMSSC